MTSPAVTTTPEATVVEAARLLDRHRITHLIVSKAGGRVTGIVTPRDLLRVYLRPDDEIRDEIVSEVLRNYLGTNPLLVKVTVADGIVTLDGEVEHKTTASYKNIVAALRSRRVSGLPVLDAAGHVVGVVSEADLLLKEARPNS